MSETPIGSIVGFLRMDADQFHRELVRAISEVEALEGKTAHVKLDVDTAGGEQKIDRVAQASRRAASGMDDMSTSSRRLTDASDRVRLAEVKLAEVHERRGAKASQIVSAEQALTRALRAQQDAIFDTYSGNLHLAESNDHVEESNKRVDRSSREAARGSGMLLTAIVALGPAIVPIAAGAVGLGVALGGMGIAGVAAVMGVSVEMAKGTSVGLKYGESIHRAEDAMSGLERVAATNVLGSFQTVVGQLVRDTPKLTSTIGEMSTMTGKAAGNLAGGLLTAFLALEPVMRDAGAYVVNLTARFDQAMSGGGVVAFGDYVRSVLPQVTSTIEGVVTAAVHLVAGFAPLGMGTLSLLQMLADAINAIPLEVLQTLAPLASGAFLGFKAWSSLSGIVKTFGDKLVELGVSAERAAAGMRILNVASGVIGAAVAILSALFAANAEDQRKAEQAANDYADALRRSNGVVDESIRTMTAKKLADDGVLEAGRKLGINLADITDAALGNADAQARVTAAIDAQSSKLKVATTGAKSGVQANTELGDSADKVKGAVLQTNDALQAGIQKNKDLAAATAVTSTAMSNQDVIAGTLAARYGMSVATYNAVKGAAQQQAAAHQKATAQMQLENDAAGLLKQSLDALAGKSLSAAQAQNGFDRAIISMSQSTRDAKGHIDKTKTALKGMSDAAVTNRGNLLNLATQANNVAEATANQTGSTEKGRQKLIAMRDQIIKTAVAQGMNRAEVQRFIDTILKVPKSVPPTKLDADTAAAHRKVTTLRDEIRDTMRDRRANLFVNVASNVASAVSSIVGSIGAIGASIHRKDGGPIPGYAGGGKLRGPGTGTSDSIVAVVRQTGRPVALSTGEYISTAASTSRNEAALEAGNKGATLGVVGQGQPGIDYELLTQMLVAAMSRVTIRPQIVAGSVDRGLGFAL